MFAIADEDLERENEQKTSSVHFLRFELTDAMIATLKEGGALAHRRGSSELRRRDSRRAGRDARRAGQGPRLTGPSRWST